MSNANWGVQADCFAPPTYGGVLRLQGTSSAQVLDLTTMAGWPGNQVSGGDGAGTVSNSTNPIGHYITIAVDAGNLWVDFADTFAHAALIDASVQVTATNGTTGAAATPFTANAGVLVTAGIPYSFWLPPGQLPQTTPYAANSKVRYMGYITSTGNTNFAVWQSSP